MSRLIFIPLMFLTGTVLAQNFIRGKILEEKTNVVVPYANVSIASWFGTASDEGGVFQLQISPAQQSTFIDISCIGYYSRRLSVDSLLSLGKTEIAIYLRPFVTTLNEVTIKEQAMSPADLVKEAIRAIPENYFQKPFNMEFYSRVTTSESSQSPFLLEALVKSYREGYTPGAVNYARIVEKRITGTTAVMGVDKKRNQQYFLYEGLPMFDVFLADMIGVGPKLNYTIFNPDYFRKLEFKLIGITRFDVDTVCIIAYDQKNFRSGEDAASGRLFIDVRNSAIVKHERHIGRNYLEVTYKEQEGSYFPYFIKTIYPWGNKSDSMIKVVHEAYIRSIVTKNPEIFKEHNMGIKNWHLEDIPYRKDFWDRNYPGKNRSVQ